MTGLPSLGPRGEGWVLIQGVLLVLVAISAATGPAWDGAARVLSSAVGAVLLVAGGVLAVRGVLDLGSALTPLPRPRAGARLVDRGAYRLVRHPIYGGLVLGGMGWGLIWAAPLSVGSSVLLFAFFALKSRREEAWLTEEVEGYGAYAKRTRRLIPFVY